MEIIAEGLHVVIKALETPGPADVIKSDARSDTAVLSVVKAAVPQRFTLGMAYPVNRLTVAKGKDGRRDIISPAEVEKTAWDWMRRSREVGLFHADGSGGHGDVVESYIHRGPTWVQKAADGSERRIHTGDWLVGVVWDEPAWVLVEKGLGGGFSPQGKAKVRPVSSERLSELIRS